MSDESSADERDDPTSRARHGLVAFVKTVRAMGDLPIALMIFVPRLCASSLVVGVAMMSRAVARLFDVTSSYEMKANLRILIVTDYMPPQTHGIAIRFRQYIDHMRSAGHEVQVFCTDAVKERESSFDHPNLPSITNPYNIHNRMAYNPGIKLAWYLGAKQWDIVHLVYPSNIGWAVLPVAAWRRIPIYCSHHVDMEYYISEYVRIKPLAEMGKFLYYLFAKLPAISFAVTNAAPTLCFLKNHIAGFRDTRCRIPTGVAESRFKVKDRQQLDDERTALLARAGYAPKADVCVLIMVQRLAPEKDTIKCLQALVDIADKATSPSAAAGRFSLDGVRPTHVVIAGHGPSRETLEHFAAAHSLPVTFLGNVPNDRLPPLYRAADVFVTCSTSETYGLTTLEALACGTPAVLPHCEVFDELWMDRIPSEWFFDSQSLPSLAGALRCAGCATSKQSLMASPIKASWADATAELVQQYEAAIQTNLPNRVELASYTRVFNQFLRAALFTALTGWLLRGYTNKAFRLLTFALDELIRWSEAMEGSL
ncbi:hypothetical protein AB1Y20_023552 [Prymnesium parvum]|uniref:Uncharacterized protein n=1 Tax=Prymnesium parvum TaxID=97485 RepID=A0AB34JFS5_PRYPA